MIVSNYPCNRIYQAKLPEARHWKPRNQSKLDELDRAWQRIILRMYCMEVLIAHYQTQSAIWSKTLLIVNPGQIEMTFGTFREDTQPSGLVHREDYVKRSLHTCPKHFAHFTFRV